MSGEGNAMLASSLDMDNMDANLFGSVGKKATKSKAGNASLSSKDETRKKSSGVDMDELSKLLGTKDIMKDLSSTKKPTLTFSSMKNGAGVLTKPADPAVDQIKEGW